MVPVEGWKTSYCQLIDDIFTSFTPDRITIGSLRGLQSLINNSKDKSWIEYLDDSSNFGKKISFNKRFEMYKTIIEYLYHVYNFSNVSLCKETIGMWKKFR